MPTNALRMLLAALDRPSALLTTRGTIIAHNKPFAEHFSAGIGADAAETLSAGPRTVSLHDLLTDDAPGWHGAEIPLAARQGTRLYWCEVYTVEDVHGAMRHLLTMHDMALYRELEAAYLHRIRHVADDNLWILDARTVLLWARTDNVELEKAVGLMAHELIKVEDRAIWENALRKAKTKPGEEVDCAVRSAIDGQPKMVTICFLAGAICGSRYYVASRGTTPTGSRVILRLKEVWQVNLNKELAQKLATSESAITRAGNADQVPATWIARTADMTGASMDWLRYGQGKKWRHEGV